MPAASPQLFFVHEVQNYGGFFGGDTVTLTGAAREARNSEQTLTIDQGALSNVRERHRIVAGMLLALTMAGDRVERAELVGAATRDELRSALGIPQFEEPLSAALIVSYACRTCGLWVAGQPRDGCCRVCGEQLGDMALPT